MMNKKKQIYVLCNHDESCSVFIVPEEQYEDENWNNEMVEEIGRYDDIDFANYEGRIFADKRGSEFEEYLPEQKPFDVPEFTLVTESNLKLIKVDVKTRKQLEFDLKYCGRAFINRENSRVDPINIINNNGIYYLTKNRK